MWPYLIAAGLGGYEGYRRSGGDLGATALGAGLGALTPGALRMAGSALGSALSGSEVAAGAAPGLLKGAAKLSQVAAEAPGTIRGDLAASGAAQLAKGSRILGNPALAGRILPGALGTLAVGGGLALGAPALAGALAAGPGRAAGQTVAQAVPGLGGSPQGWGAPAQYGGDAIPPGMGQFGYVDAYGNPIDIASPAGVAAGRRLEYAKTIEQQRDAMRMLLPEIQKASEARSKSEFQRQLAAAGVRQNILTAANMLERSQQAAQQMGATAAQQAGSALVQQFQYS